MSPAAACSLASRAVRRRASSLHLLIAAWRALTWRHWLGAAAVGLVCSLGQSLQRASSQWGMAPAAKLETFLRMTIGWTPLLMVLACLLMLGLAVLEQQGSNPARQSRRYVLLVLALGASSVLVIDPAAQTAANAIKSALGLSGQRQLLAKSMTDAGPVFIMLSLWTLVYLYIRNARRTARALAAAQLRRADVERRVLAEQLQSAQAMVEPAFLFDTLTLIEQSFEREPALAQRILEALIRYLRAALPSMEDSGSTLGQQAELVRAYLEIERARSGERLRARVDVPAALEPKPFAPLLVLPLVANAVRHGALCAPGGSEVTVRARDADGALQLDVEDDGPGRAASIREGAGLAAVRERLAALYGDRGRLALVDRVPRGISARLEISEASR